MFVGTRISIRFQLTLIGFQTYISGIIIAGVSRDGDRSIEGGGGGGYFINTKSTLNRKLYNAEPRRSPIPKLYYVVPPTYISIPVHLIIITYSESVSQ